MNGNDPKRTKLCSATSSNYTVFHTAWRDEGWETFAENLAMQWRMYDWASTKSFSAVAEMFPKTQIIAWVFAFLLQAVVIFMGILLEIVLFAFLFARLLVVQLSSVFDHRQG